jgi:hypothetical protein
MQAANPRKLSWAIQWRSRPEKRLYWGALGVEIIDIPLEQFLLGLDRTFNSIAGSKSAAS